MSIFISLLNTSTKKIWIITAWKFTVELGTFVIINFKVVKNLHHEKKNWKRVFFENPFRKKCVSKIYKNKLNIKTWNKKNENTKWWNPTFSSYQFLIVCWIESTKKETRRCKKMDSINFCSRQFDSRISIISKRVKCSLKTG